MDHGLVFLSESAVTSCETNFLNGNTLDIIATTWNEGSGFAKDSWWGPTWSGQSGSGSELDKKIADIRNTFDGTGRTFGMLYTISRSTTSGDFSDYEYAANGNYDTQFYDWASDLISKGMGDTIVRPSAEFNQTWSKRYPEDPGTGNSAPDQYADAFARCRREFKDATDDNSGPGFTFLYSPAGNSQGIAYDAWPTDSTYWPSGVDPPTVAWSLYNASWVWSNYTTSEIQAFSDSQYQTVSQQAWDNQIKGRFDLGIDLATDKGADVATIEWGPASIKPTRYPAAGGDDPYFMARAMDYMEANNFTFEVIWNVGSNVSGYHQIYPQSVADLNDSGDYWSQRVITDLESGSAQTVTGDSLTIGLSVNGGDVSVSSAAGVQTVTGDSLTIGLSVNGGSVEPIGLNIGGYTLIQRGTIDWDDEMNQNFADIEADIDALEAEIGAGASVSLNQPTKGTTDWQTPTNANWASIESAVETLASAVGVDDVGGYEQPEKGREEYQIPLNRNLAKIDDDLTRIEAAIP